MTHVITIAPALARDLDATRAYLAAQVSAIGDDPLMVDGLPIELYHGTAGSISKSGLDDVNKSGKHFYGRHLDPQRPPRETKGGQLEGSLAHCAVLEPKEFASRYVTGPDVNRNTKDWKAFEAAAPTGALAIKPHQFETAWAQAKEVRALPEIASALRTGAAESSLYWTDAETGVRCRCRPDWLTAPIGDSPGVIVVDLKTFRSAEAGAVQRQIATKRYHVQAAFYSDGVEAVLGRPVLAFVFAFVEAEYPYAANAFMLDDAAIELGRRAYRADLARYRDCLASGVWPGYGQGVTVLGLPAWAFYEGDS